MKITDATTNCLQIIFLVDLSTEYLQKYPITTSQREISNFLFSFYDHNPTDIELTVIEYIKSENILIWEAETFSERIA